MGYDYPSSGFAIWLTGLPSSGKSSLAKYLSEILGEEGIPVQVLDSDELREWLTPNPTYSKEERDWFYQVLVRIAELLTSNGVNILIAATGSRRAYRENARKRIKYCAIVHLECPAEVCRRRDSKGLWEKADRGEIDNLPGAGVPYDLPITPEVEVDTSLLSPDQAAQYVFNVLEHIDFYEVAPDTMRRGD